MDFTPRRIVSLQPSATVVLSSIGVLDRLVACTKYCEEVCPGVSDGRLIVADSWSAQADQILAAHPDLVIASVPYQREAVEQILKSGARFLGVAPKTLADIYGDIAAVAGIVGLSEAGAALIKSMQQSISAVRSRIPKNQSRPRVFCEEWGKPIIASQPWVAELVDAVGGEFVSEPGKQTTPEAIVSLNPDIVVAAWCGAGDRVPLDKIAQRPGWDHILAVRQQQLYCVPDPYFNTPGPTLLQGLSALAAIIHPALFPEVPAVRRIRQSQPADMI